MTGKQKDPRRALEEMVRQLMAAASGGMHQPVFVGVNVVVTTPGGFPTPPQRARGEGTEPEIEVHRIGDRVLLATEMPGLPPEKIRILFRGDRVFVWGRDGERQYRSSARVPPPRAGSEQVSFRHGVLEVSYVPLSGDDSCRTDTSPDS